MWDQTRKLDFRARRTAFLRKLGKAVALLPSSPHAFRNDDVRYPYRQDSSFHYLSGFDEPDSFLLLCPAQKHPFQMFVRPRDREREIWEGHIEGPEGVRTRHGADAAAPSIPEGQLDEAFILALLESGSLTRDQIAGLAARHGLAEAWKRFERRFPDE